MPYYPFEDFKTACGRGASNVVPINDVPQNAREDFNLKTTNELLDFIFNDGLEDLRFVNTKDWEKNPDPSNEIKVDAYEFRSMNKLGYIAFMHNVRTGKWIIKSFHLSSNSNLAMRIAFQKAQRIKEIENA